MPTLQDYRGRRTRFLDRIEGPVLLMAGGWHSRNYPHNPFPYRPDSNFLYFFASPEPDSAALFDPADRTVRLFLHERTPEDALWHGAVPDFDAMKVKHGVDEVSAVEGMLKTVRGVVSDRSVHSIAVSDHHATALARGITGEELDFTNAAKVAHPDLIQTIGQMRAYKSADEIDEMRATAAVTREAHTAAMAHTAVGILEQDLAGRVTGTFARNGCVPAYNNILSVRGEVLHNNDHSNTLRDGDLILLDAGAENSTGYCSDVTRAWPVNGTFGAEAAAVYDIVLEAEKKAIDGVRPGVRYRDLHMLGARVIVEGLVGMGLLKGHADALVESGAHTLFFPHGIGHLIGLDVHDMEAFGDAIAYPSGRTRSSDFGTAYLRLDMDCAPGLVFTIEPGIYFVPALLHKRELREQFREQVDFDKCEAFLAMNDGRGFGGIRIEDDILVTENGAENLTTAIPKERKAVEELVGSAVR